MRFSAYRFWFCLFLIFVLVLGGCGTDSVTPLATTTPIPTPTSVMVASATGEATFTPMVKTATPTVPAILPPTQPLSGPGGANYSHKTVVQHVYGSGEDQYYLFEPADPVPESAPLIILLHGWSDLSPNRYQAWINHLVKRGNLIIYPVYQPSPISSGENFTSSAAKAVKAGLEQLKQGKIKPELDKVSFFGYSAGGVVATNLVALSESLGLPTPRSLFLMTPGGSLGLGLNPASGLKLEISGFKLEEATNLGKIAPTTKLLVMVADRDQVVGDRTAKFIWQSTSQIPGANKAYLLINSDTHGSKPLIADHSIAQRTPPNALNFYGMWKLFDALQSCTLLNQDCETALGDTPAQRYMGKWSDDQPVKELTFIKNP